MISKDLFSDPSVVHLAFFIFGFEEVVFEDLLLLFFVIVISHPIVSEVHVVKSGNAAAAFFKASLPTWV